MVWGLDVTALKGGGYTRSAAAVDKADKDLAAISLPWGTYGVVGAVIGGGSEIVSEIWKLAYNCNTKNM